MTIHSPLTRRGAGVLFILGFCLVMAWVYGTRGLGALIIPLLVVGVTGLVSFVRTETPTVRREPVEPGFSGDSRTVALELEFPSGPRAATVADSLGEGVTAVAGGNVGQVPARATADTDSDSDFDTDTGTPTTTDTSTSRQRYHYDVHLAQRGVHELGPVSVTVRDVFGLTARRVTLEATESVLVYPTVYSLRGDTFGRLTASIRDGIEREFDHLRAYERGDSPKDIHWKATAKRADGDLVVGEYVSSETAGVVEVASEAAEGAVEEMAAATASVSQYLLESDIAVGLTTPDGRCEPGESRSSSDQRTAILRLLAVATAGTVPSARRQEADIVVRSRPEGTTIQTGEKEVPFDRVRGEPISQGEMAAGVRRDSLSQRDTESRATYEH